MRKTTTPVDVAFFIMSAVPTAMCFIALCVAACVYVLLGLTDEVHRLCNIAGITIGVALIVSLAQLIRRINW